MTNQWISRLRYMIFVFPIILLGANLKNIIFQCVNANDFAIYQQAIFEVAAGNSWNPYLTVRNLHILNDHFDPVFYLAAPLARLMNYSPLSLIIFEWLIFAFSLFLILKLIPQKKENKEFWIISVFLIFSRSLLLGLEAPIHTTTWSMLGALLLPYLLKTKKYNWLYLCLIYLCLCRESYIFMMSALIFYFLVNKNWKHFVASFSFFVLLSLFYFKLRPLLLGPTVDYGNSLLEKLFSDPIQTLISQTKLFFPSLEWKVFLPYLIPIGILIKIQGRELKHFFKSYEFSILLFSSIGFFIHFLAGRMVHQHSVPIIAPILGLILFSEVPKYLSERKFLLWICLALTLFTASSKYTKNISSLFLNKVRNCKMDSEKTKAMDELHAKIKSIGHFDNVIATGGLVIKLVKPGRKVYQFFYASEIQDKYDFLALEKAGDGSTWPLAHSEINRIEEMCKKEGSEVLIDNKYFVLVKGPLSDKCLEQSRMFPQDNKFYMPTVNR